MQIERIEIVGFGCLAHRELRLEPGRAHLLAAGNEAGKSTLLAAVETALYGWPPARTQEGRALRQQYRPWTGGASRVTLELRDAARQIRIEQVLLDAAGQPVERVTVWEDRRDRTDELLRAAATPGEWLLRLGRDDFRRSVLVRQGELDEVARETGSLVRHLEALATSATAGASAVDAQARLAAALEDYRAVAGLEHWAQDHLAHARQWARVEPRLIERIAHEERRAAGLRQRRERLAAEVAALEEHEARREALQRARAALHTLERVIQRRHVQRQLDEDDRQARELKQLEARLAALDDVRTFPADRGPELHRLLEREAQLRRQLGEAEAQAATLAGQVAEAAARLDRLAALRELAGQADELAAQHARLAQAVADEQDAAGRVDAAAHQLENAGVPLARLREARGRYLALAADERQAVASYERRLLEIEQQRSAEQQALDAAQRTLERIAARRRRARLALASLGLLLALAGAAAAAWFHWSGGLAGAVAAGLAGALAYATRWLDAYEHDARRAAVARGTDALARLDGQRADAQARLDELAARQGLTAAALREQVQFYLAHRDDFEAFERAAARQREAREAVTVQRQRWAERLAAAGRARPEDERAVEAAAALVRDVRQAAALAAERDDLRRRHEQATRTAARLAAETRQTQEALAALLAAAGVRLALPARADALVPPEELVVARKEFEARAERWEQRRSLAAAADVARERRLPAEKRAELEARAARLDEELHAAAGGAAPDKLLTEIRAAATAEGLGALPAVPAEALAPEDVAALAEQVGERSAALLAEQTRTWQEARAFLREYTRELPAVESELARLRAELARGQRFAAAIGIARQTLEAVQANSYGRWSELLAGRLRPLLAEFLPDYRLDGVAADLAPVLVHVPTGQRLDLPAIRLHLSRGAKDRLFLALRLALAEVLGAECGVALPLLLDDPLANWDDAALVGGLRALGRLGTQGRALLLFTCQRSRCAAALEQLGDRPDVPVLVDFA